jgi:hypothetical protein
MLEKPPKTIPTGHLLYENTLIEETFAEMCPFLEMSPENSSFFVTMRNQDLERLHFLSRAKIKS